MAKKESRGMFQRGLDAFGNTVGEGVLNAFERPGENVSKFLSKNGDSIERFISQNGPALAAAISGTLVGNPSIGAISSALADIVGQQLFPNEWKNPSTAEKIRNGIVKTAGISGLANETVKRYTSMNPQQQQSQNQLAQSLNQLSPQDQMQAQQQSPSRFSGLTDWFQNQKPEIQSQILSAVPGLAKVLGSGAGAIYNSFNSKPELLQQIGHYPEDQQSLINQIRTGGMKDILELAEKERQERNAPTWNQRYEQYAQQNPNLSRITSALGSAVPVGLATGGLGFLPTLIGGLGYQYTPEISKYGQSAYNNVSNRLSRLF
jgi:hypothetical protein